MENKIIQTIKSVVLDQYKEDIDLLVVYGSYVSNNMNEMSDIDMFFVPNTDKSYSLMKTFILNDIGYDLWPIDWTRLEGFSNFLEPYVSILANSEVVYARNEEVEKRFNDLKKQMMMQMSKEGNGHLLWRIGFLFEQVESKLFRLSRESTFEQEKMLLLAILEDFMNIVAYFNQTYVLKGAERLELELKRFDYIPEYFKETFYLVATSNDLELLKEKVLMIYDELSHKYQETKRVKETSLNDELVGAYEELKSTYNKVEAAVNDHDVVKLAYALMAIQRETTHFFGENHDFPQLLVDYKSEEELRKAVNRHESKFIEFLEFYKVNVNYLNKVEDIKTLFE